MTQQFIKKITKIMAQLNLLLLHLHLIFLQAIITDLLFSI